MPEKTAALLYDGPIGNPFSTKDALVADIERLRAWLRDPEAFTLEGRAQVEGIVAEGEAQLAEGEYRKPLRPPSRASPDQ